jgi:hypothetical protein
MAFHLGDTVLETKTQRQGKIDELRSDMFRVILLDGQQPLIQYYKDIGDFELVTCPHAEPEPRFVPERGIMG